MELERQGVLLEKSIRARTENTPSWDADNIPPGSIPVSQPPVRGDNVDGATLLENDRNRACPAIEETVSADKDNDAAARSPPAGCDELDNKARNDDVPDIVKDTPPKPPRATLTPSPSSLPSISINDTACVEHDSMSGPSSIEVEDMIMQLFDLVNLKNELFRRQTELMYL